MIEQFSQQITIPPDTEVYGEMSAIELQVLLMLWVIRILCAIDHFPLDIPDTMTIAAPHLYTGIGRVDIRCHGTSHITLAGNLEDDLTCACIPEI